MRKFIIIPEDKKNIWDSYFSTYETIDLAKREKKHNTFPTTPHGKMFASMIDSATDSDKKKGLLAFIDRIKNQAENATNNDGLNLIEHQKNILLLESLLLLKNNKLELLFSEPLLNIFLLERLEVSLVAMLQIIYTRTVCADNESINDAKIRLSSDADVQACMMNWSKYSDILELYISQKLYTTSSYFICNHAGLDRTNMLGELCYQTQRENIINEIGYLYKLLLQASQIEALCLTKPLNTNWFSNQLQLINTWLDIYTESLISFNSNSESQLDSIRQIRACAPTEISAQEASSTMSVINYHQEIQTLKELEQKITLAPIKDNAFFKNTYDIQNHNDSKALLNKTIHMLDELTNKVVPADEYEALIDFLSKVIGSVSITKYNESQQQINALTLTLEQIKSAVQARHQKNQAFIQSNKNRMNNIKIKKEKNKLQKQPASSREETMQLILKPPFKQTAAGKNKAHKRDRREKNKLYIPEALQTILDTLTAKGYTAYATGEYIQKACQYKITNETLYDTKYLDSTSSRKITFDVLSNCPHEKLNELFGDPNESESSVINGIIQHHIGYSTIFITSVVDIKTALSNLDAYSNKSGAYTVRTKQNNIQNSPQPITPLYQHFSTMNIHAECFLNKKTEQKNDTRNIFKKKL